MKGPLLTPMLILFWKTNLESEKCHTIKEGNVSYPPGTILNIFFIPSKKSSNIHAWNKLKWPRKAIILTKNLSSFQLAVNVKDRQHYVDINNHFIAPKNSA